MWLTYLIVYIELKYPQTYDPMARMRGSEAKEDVAARTFCEVMEPHLKRAIRRQSGDSWT
jgi:hypothetical protein